MDSQDYEDRVLDVLVSALKSGIGTDKLILSHIGVLMILISLSENPRSNIGEVIEMLQEEEESPRFDWFAAEAKKAMDLVLK